jgi:hypothetical protein
VFHPQLADTIDLARTFPDANIIAGHVGGPLGYGPYAGQGDAVFAAWKAHITELARCPNVVMKLGGMMVRLAAYDYGALPAPPSSAEIAAYWRPYMETCIELFGPERCMFESNFPVEKMGTGWVSLWNAFKRIAAGASEAEKHALFSGTLAFSSSSDLAVMPPGRARLSTRPTATGSATPIMTMGIVDVAFLAARFGSGATATMRSTLSETRSAASAGRRSR